MCISIVSCRYLYAFVYMFRCLANVNNRRGGCIWCWGPLSCLQNDIIVVSRGHLLTTITKYRILKDSWRLFTRLHSYEPTHKDEVLEFKPKNSKITLIKHAFLHKMFHTELSIDFILSSVDESFLCPGGCLLNVSFQIYKFRSFCSK